MERRRGLDPEISGVGIGHVNAERTVLAEEDQSGSMLGAGSWMAYRYHVLEWERGWRKRIVNVKEEILDISILFQ